MPENSVNGEEIVKVKIADFNGNGHFFMEILLEENVYNYNFRTTNIEGVNEMFQVQRLFMNISNFVNLFILIITFTSK